MGQPRVCDSDEFTVVIAYAMDCMNVFFNAADA